MVLRIGHLNVVAKPYRLRNRSRAVGSVVMSKDMSKKAEHRPAKDYTDPPLAPLFDIRELRLWSFYRALIVEFIGMLL